MQKLKPGFSLIEVLILLFIIGVVAAISIPKFTNSNAHLTLQTTHDNLLLYLKRIQSTASSTKNSITTHIQRDDNSLIISFTSSLPHQKTVLFSDQSFTIPSTLQCQSSLMLSHIQFEPDGSIVLFNAAQQLSFTEFSFTLQTGSVSKSIHIFPLSNSIQSQ